MRGEAREPPRARCDNAREVLSMGHLGRDSVPRVYTGVRSRGTFCPARTKPAESQEEVGDSVHLTVPTSSVGTVATLLRWGGGSPPESPLLAARDR